MHAGVRAALADARPEPVAEAAAPRQFDSVPQAVDTLLAEGWEQRKVSPAPPVDDAVWGRRVIPDLAARIPTPAELADFRKAPPESRRAALEFGQLGAQRQPEPTQATTIKRPNTSDSQRSPGRRSVR